MLLVFIKAKGLTDAFSNALITVGSARVADARHARCISYAITFAVATPPACAHNFTPVRACAQVRRASRGLSKLVPMDAGDRELLQFQVRERNSAV